MARNIPYETGPQRDELDAFSRRLAERRAKLGGATLRVLHFIDENRVVALASSAAELAERTGTSDATVIRAVQALGFRGLPELRQALSAALQERPAIVESMRRTLDEVGENIDQAIRHGLDTHRRGLAALSHDATRALLRSAVEWLHQAQRIVLFGLGPSAPLARYTALLLQRVGRKTKTLERTGAELADQLLDLGPGDTMLLLSYGDPYPEIIAVMDEAARLGLATVLVTDIPNGDIAARAGIVIPVQRGEAERVALHGTTLICLETLVLGLAASDKDKAVGTLEQLSRLRRSITGRRTRPPG